MALVSILESPYFNGVRPMLYFPAQMVRNAQSIRKKRENSDYGGHTLDAPSRDASITCPHPEHAFIRNNQTVGDEG